MSDSDHEDASSEQLEELVLLNTGPGRPGSSSLHAPKFWRWISVAALSASAMGVAVVLVGQDGGSPADGNASGSSFEVDNMENSGLFVGEFDYLDGSLGTIQSQRGRPLVLNFFGSWCAPCRAEMPEFEEVYQRVGDDVAFLGLGVNDRRQDAQRLVDETAVSYPVGLDSSNLAADLAAIAMPTTVFVDSDGLVVGRELGQISGEQLLERIESLFGVDPGP